MNISVYSSPAVKKILAFPAFHMNDSAFMKQNSEMESPILFYHLNTCDSWSKTVRWNDPNQQIQQFKSKSISVSREAAVWELTQIDKSSNSSQRVVLFREQQSGNLPNSRAWLPRNVHIMNGNQANHLNTSDSCCVLFIQLEGNCRSILLTWSSLDHISYSLAPEAWFSNSRSKLIHTIRDKSLKHMC